MPTQRQVPVAAAIKTRPQGERADAHCPAVSEPMPTQQQAMVVAASRTTPTSGRAGQCPLRAQCRLKDERVGMKLAGVGCEGGEGGSQVGYKGGGIGSAETPETRNRKTDSYSLFSQVQIGAPPMFTQIIIFASSQDAKDTDKKQLRNCHHKVEVRRCVLTPLMLRWKCRIPTVVGTHVESYILALRPRDRGFQCLPFVQNRHESQRS